VASPAPGAQRQATQRQAAQADASHDGHAADDLREADRVPERHRADDGSHQRLDVDERPGDLGGDPALPECEESERQQRAAPGQRDDRQHRAGATRHGRHATGDDGNRQRAERGAEELDGGDRDRVASVQQAALGHDERGRQDERRQHQPVPGQCRAAAPAAHGDQADAAERQREAEPGHWPGHGVVPHRGDDRDQHRHGPDQQGGVSDAGPADAGVLQ
jgi:hypothetical protein